MNLKPLRKRLEEVSKKTSLRLDVLQQDYILSWLLVGIFQNPLLKSSLIFKGGTALKKCFFGDYRFSEDLDFSTTEKCPSGKILLEAMADSVKHAEKQMEAYGIQLHLKKYEEKQPHPQGQEAFIIAAQFPWQSQPLTKTMVEISRDEHIVLSPVSKQLLHEYGEPIDQNIPVYALEEIILEKLRAILQHIKKLHERDWSRSRARDYYDLWRIFGAFEDQIEFELIPRLLPIKCAPKDVSFHNHHDFFDEKMISNVQKSWNQWLGPLVPQLPACEKVLEELKPKIERLLSISIEMA